MSQIPNVNGAIVALDPHTGRVLAMSGGYSFEKSEFNRATQAKRQPGSAFKPIVYAAALEQGYRPNDLIRDEPFVIEIPGSGTWSPQNYKKQFKNDALNFAQAAIKFVKILPKECVDEASLKRIIKDLELPLCYPSYSKDTSSQINNPNAQKIYVNTYLIIFFFY